MTKRKLALAIALATAGTVWMGAASAAEKADVHKAVDTYELDPVNVEGEQAAESAAEETMPGGFVSSKPSVGLLGAQDVMDAPYSVTEFNQKTMRTFSSPADGINSVLSLHPSVRVLTSHLYQDIAIRGFRISGHSVYVNGIPGLLGQMNLPHYWVDSVSVISGPNLGVSGTTLNEAVGGTVNYISKKAERNAVEARLSYLGGSSVEEAVDVSNRFGKDDRYGVRITATNTHGETAIEHEKLNRQNIFVNLDRQTEKSRTNLLLGYNHTKHNAGPMRINFKFGSSNVTALPSAPDLSRSYKPAWSYNEYDNIIAALNHEQKLGAHLTAFLNAGYHHENWYGYVDGSPTVMNNSGDFTISMSNYPLDFTRTYVGIGLRGDFRTGAVRHDYIVGMDQNWLRNYGGENPSFSWSGTGNIYRDNTWASPEIPHMRAPHSRNTRLTGWHIVDTMKAFDDRLQVTVGVHGHSVKLSPAGKSSTKTDAISPTVAVNYRVAPNVTVYANHTESFGLGSTVSTSNGYANAGEMLDPSKTKQNEIGVKMQTGNFLNTFSYFEIRQANAIDVYEGTRKYRRIDGEQKNKGVEWAFTGTIGKKLELIGGVAYLDVRQSKTSRGANDGKRVDGMPYWSGTLGMVYRPTTDWSLIARMNYVGDSVINSGAIPVPSHMLFDLGATYRTKMGTTPVTFSAMIYNVMGKDYWNPRAGESTSLALGAPRTFTFSANFEI